MRERANNFAIFTLLFFLAITVLQMSACVTTMEIMGPFANSNYYLASKAAFISSLITLIILIFVLVTVVVGVFHFHNDSESRNCIFPWYTNLVVLANTLSYVIIRFIVQGPASGPGVFSIIVLVLCLILSLIALINSGNGNGKLAQTLSAIVFFVLAILTFVDIIVSKPSGAIAITSLIIKIVGYGLGLGCCIGIRNTYSD